MKRYIKGGIIQMRDLDKKHQADPDRWVKPDDLYQPFEAETRKPSLGDLLRAKLAESKCEMWYDEAKDFEPAVSDEEKLLLHRRKKMKRG